MHADIAKSSKRNPFNTLFFKILAGVVAVATLLWATNYVLTNRVSRDVAAFGVTSKIEVIGNLLSDGMVGAVRFGDTGAISRQVEAVMRDAGGSIVTIAVYDAQGNTLVGRGEPLDVDTLADVNQRAMSVNEPAWDRDSLRAAFPIRNKDGEVFGGIAFRGDTAADLNLVRSKEVLIFGGDAIALAIGLLGFAFALRQQITTPLNHVRSAVGQIADKDYSIDLHAAARGDEIGAISRSVVELRDKLRDADNVTRMAMYQSAAFSGTSIPMLMTDADATIVAVNGTFRELAREHLETFTTHWQDFDVDNLIGQSIDQFHKNPEHQRALLADGSRLPHRTDIMFGGMIVELSAQQVLDENGAYAGNILEWQHVTRVRENAGVIGALMASQGFMTLDVDGSIIEANAIVSDWSGYRLDELVGANQTMLRDPDDAIMDGLWEAALRGELAKAQVSRRKNDGDKVWLDVTLAPVKDSHGKVFRIVEFSQDITREVTEKQQVEEHAARTSAAQTTAVNELGKALAALANGDLAIELSNPFDADYDSLRSDFNAAVSGLRAAISDIVEVSVNILGGAGEIAKASDDLSRRTESQAATLEQTAAALDEITSSVKSTADDSEGADKAVANARESAKSGGSVVLEAVDAMHEIENSSEQISKIITVIDDIAFQTNLLALNAGVEAARAGEAGRGFAVVASEVRALAQRSSEAAKQIKGLISTSAHHVKNGVSLVGRSGDALTHIVESVESISDLIASIANASRDQSTGLSEINSGVVQLDDVTQQNAAMVEQATAASHAMRAEAERLGELVSSFQLVPASDVQAPHATQVPSVAPPRTTPTDFAPMADQERREVSATHQIAVNDDAGWEEF